MRLLKSEHKKIMETASDFGLVDDVQLVKKKGWVHVKIKGAHFAFHRKTKSQLVQGKLVDQNSYFTRTSKETLQKDTFDEVIDWFRQWLKEGRFN